MRTNTLMSLVLLSAVCVTPAMAQNWFFDPATGTSRNIGSAPNPTPADLQALRAGFRTTVFPVQERISIDQLRDMDGKMVFGENGEQLGSIIAVDEGAALVDLQTPGGVAVAVEARLLINESDRVVAPTLSETDVIAMAEAQTGNRLAFDETFD